MTRLAALALVLVLGLTTPAVALTTYYVAPNSTTAHTGAAATPWTDIAQGWSTINTTLATDDVTVYFTARKAASDTNETTTSGIALLRTDTSTHRLTLDGMSQYSTSNSAPSWLPYSGASRFQITASLPVSSENFSSPFPMRNYITIRGYVLISTGGQIAALEGMGNLIFELNDASATSAATNGAAVFTGISGTGATNWGSHIIIRNNTIHDTQGECIYIGGSTPDPPGTGAPTNTGDDILIQGNTIMDCGRWGAQGDGVDTKDGHTNLRIIGNTIRLTNNTFALTDNQCMSIESADLIDGNYCEGRGIVTSAAWNTQVGRDRLIIRNNIFVAGTLGQGGTASGAIELGEAHAAAYQWANTQVYNNSIYSFSGSCIQARAPRGASIVENNIMQACGGDAVTANAAGLITTHDYNVFFAIGRNALALAGTNTTCAGIATRETHSNCVDPRFVNTSAPYADTHFRVQASSPVIGAGVDLSAIFTNDHSGVTRGVPWDIGAWAFTVSVGALPSAPTQLLLR